MDERLLEILEDIQPEADYETCTTLIDDHYLNSLAIISLVAELEEEFDITIPTVEIIPENFNSAEAMWNMITRLQEEG
jgi:acyl carrier protein